MWQVDYTLIHDWLHTLDRDTVRAIILAVEVLEQEGPNPGRPLVDTVHNSRLRNMKELRPPSPGTSEIRILFAFDPERRAILLLGGDKAVGKNNERKWNGWYKASIPMAEQLYEQHIESLRGRKD